MSRSALSKPYLDPLRLIEFSRFFAAEVESGAYPDIDYTETERWHQRIYRDPRMDVWLISWLPSQGTELHDHGGSSGSFTVVSGVLSEAVHSPARLTDVRHAAGASAGFGPRYVHDVRNLDAGPAVSVHVYSPPLTSMTYYDRTAAGLVPIATVPTDDPEPALAKIA